MDRDHPAPVARRHEPSSVREAEPDGRRDEQDGDDAGRAAGEPPLMARERDAGHAGTRASRTTGRGRNAPKTVTSPSSDTTRPPWRARTRPARRGPDSSAALASVSASSAVGASAVTP